MIWWAIIVSNFTFALLLSLILKWSGARGFLDGLKTGAIFGFLMALSMDLSFYSMSTMFNNVTAIAVDVVVNTVAMAIIGLVIVLTWGKEK
jgi:hypothetical protein